MSSKIALEAKEKGRERNNDEVTHMTHQCTYELIQDGAEKADERRNENLTKLTLCTGQPRL